MLAAGALDDGFRFLVAVGNDATVQDVVNGMFRDGHPIREEPVLGVVAAGSGCDLVLSFGLPDDTEGAASHLTGENTYALDLMKITATGPDGERRTRYGHNLAQVGMGAQQVACATKAPPWLGGARRFYGWWCGYLKTKPTDVTIEHDRRTWEGEAWNVVVANAQFTDGGLRSPRSFPGDGVLDALVFTGPRSAPTRSSRGCSATATTSPIRRSRSSRRESGSRSAPSGRLDPGGRRPAGDHAGDLPDRPPIDPPEAVTAAHLDRIARAQAEIEAHGLDALVLSPSPDLRYLDGVRPDPVRTPDAAGAATPRRPRPARSRARTAARGGLAGGGRMELVGWRDGSDPYEAAASILGGSARVAVADRVGLAPAGAAGRCPGRPSRPGRP